MIQILYTNDSLYNAKLIDDAKEYAARQEFEYIPPKRKRTIYTSGMLMKSFILMIVACTVFLVGLGSWNVASEAMSQEEIWISKIPEVSTAMKQNINQTALALKENTVQEAKLAKKELVVKKVVASNGKKYDAIAYLSIPSLGIKYPVLSKTNTELLKASLNKYWGPNPNQVGNLCIVGHNYNDSRFFGKLNQIQLGEEIIITEMDGEALSYYVYQTDMIDPYDTSCTSQLTGGRKEITLITCNYDGSQRFIAKARANE